MRIYMLKYLFVKRCWSYVIKQVTQVDVKTLTLRWPRGRVEDAPPSRTGFSNFSQKWQELSLQTKFLPVGSSLGHLPMKQFSNRTYRLGSKIKQREGAREVPPH